MAKHQEANEPIFSEDGRYRITFGGSGSVLLEPVGTYLSNNARYYLRQGKVFAAVQAGKVKSDDDLKKVAFAAGYKTTPRLHHEGYIEYSGGKFNLTLKGVKEYRRIRLLTWNELANTIP